MELEMENNQRIFNILGVNREIENEEAKLYLERVRCFLQGQDFLRLGHCIQGKQWHLVMSNSAKMKQHCEELEITCFDGSIAAVRDAARRQRGNEALQIMSHITAKRVQLRNLLAEEEKQCDM